MLLATIIDAAELTEQVYSRSVEFANLDTNGDGFLSAAEYNGTRRLFDATDTNGDNKLSLEEAKYVITFSDIPSGSFMMGSDAAGGGAGMSLRHATPVHEVSVDGFHLSSTEITTAQYALFLNSALEAGQIVVERANSGPARIEYPVPIWTVSGAAGTAFEGKPYTALSPVSGLSHIRADGHPLLIPEHPLNQSWISYIPELQRFTVALGFEDWPAVFIRWYGAMAFADFYGLSLPTEAEWEYAARGGQQFRYATSDGTIDCGVANYKCYNGMRQENFQGVDMPDEYIGHRINVGSYPANPYGVFDLAGSAWEWCLDWYGEDFYQRTVDDGIVRNPLNLNGEEPPLEPGVAQGGPRGGYTHDARVTRGGSYQYNEATTASAYRARQYPFRGNDHWGFRVVLRPSSTVFNGTE
jgi:formylglycine-generating enzyme required for sulfatase activity